MDDASLNLACNPDTATFEELYHLGYNVYTLTQKMKATCSSEMLVDFQQVTWRYITEDITLHNHPCENLKSVNFFLSGCKTSPVVLRS
jgi:hypothetical protein